MKKQITIPTIIITIALLATGCIIQTTYGSGNVVSDTRQVSQFTRVTLAGIGELLITQGQSESLVIEAEDNLIPYFEIKVQGGTLTIGMKPGMINLRPTKPIKFHVTLEEIEGLTLAGSGNIQASTLETTDFALSLLGSGNISIEDLTCTMLNINLAGSGNIELGGLAAEEITTRFTGSGSVTLSGEVAEQKIEIIGSGQYHADQLQSQQATVVVSGSGDTRLTVSDELNVTILGSGDVYYYGDPQLDLNVTGSGGIHQLD